MLWEGVYMRALPRFPYLTSKESSSQESSAEMRMFLFLRLLSGLVFLVGSMIALVGPVLLVLVFVGELPGEQLYVAVLFGFLICLNGIVIAVAGHVMWSSCTLRQQRASKPSPALPRTLDATLKPEPATNVQQTLLPAQVLKVG